jgi:hypothetical protein
MNAKMSNREAWNTLLAQGDRIQADMDKLVQDAEQAAAPEELLITLRYAAKSFRAERYANRMVCEELWESTEEQREAWGWKLTEEGWDEMFPECLAELEAALDRFKVRFRQWLDVREGKPTRNEEKGGR